MKSTARAEFAQDGAEQESGVEWRPSNPEWMFDGKRIRDAMSLFGLDERPDVAAILQAFAAQEAVSRKWYVRRLGQTVYLDSATKAENHRPRLTDGTRTQLPDGTEIGVFAVLLGHDRGPFLLTMRPWQRHQADLLHLGEGQPQAPDHAGAALLRTRLAELCDRYLPAHITLIAPFAIRLSQTSKRQKDELSVECMVEGGPSRFLLPRAALLASGEQPEGSAGKKLLASKDGPWMIGALGARAGSPVLTIDRDRMGAQAIAALLETLARSAADALPVVYRGCLACVDVAVGTEGTLAFEAMAAVGWDSNSAWWWLTAPVAPAARMRRRQAAAAFPGLAGLIGMSPSSGGPLGDAVDRGASPVPAIQTLLGCSKTTAKTLATSISGGSFIERVTAHQLKAGTELLDELPPDLHPGRGAAPAAEWKLFEHWLVNAGAPYMREVTRNSGAPWRCQGIVDRQGARIDTLPASALGDDTGDALEAFLRQVVIPACGVWHSKLMEAPLLATRTPGIIELIVGTRGHPAMRASGEEWHRQILAIDTAALPPGDIQVSWPALCSPFERDGLVLQPITTMAGLKAEGRELAHCVATYVAPCLAGTSHILSVRTQDGRRLSTVELAADWDAEPTEMLEVTQHKGYDNADPSEEATDLLDAFMEAIRHGHFAVRRDECQTWIERRRGPGHAEAAAAARSDCMASAGYDIFDVGARQLVFEAWRFFLPRGDRSMSYGEWLMKHGLAAVDLSVGTDRPYGGVVWVHGAPRQDEPEGDPPASSGEGAP